MLLITRKVDVNFPVVQHVGVSPSGLHFLAMLSFYSIFYISRSANLFVDFKEIQKVAIAISILSPAGLTD
jgi:hypothetical protein